jgi:uncharacterized membrane protein YdjX (TVP38/TMEM64 family)
MASIGLRMDTKETNSSSFKPLLSLLIILALVTAVVIMQHTGLARFATLENVEKISAFVQSTGAWGPAVYILVCIVASLLFCPGIPLLLLAVPFGALRGTIYAVIGLTLGSSASFLLARYTLRSFIENYAKRNPMFRKIDDGVKREGWRMVMFTRLVPVFPYNLQNFAYGLTAIPLWIFALVSGICMLPAIAAYVFAGGALISGQGDAKKTFIYLLIGGLLFVLLSFLPRWIKKWNGSPVDEDVPRE